MKKNIQLLINLKLQKKIFVKLDLVKNKRNKADILIFIKKKL